MPFKCSHEPTMTGPVWLVISFWFCFVASDLNAEWTEFISMMDNNGAKQTFVDVGCGDALQADSFPLTESATQLHWIGVCFEASPVRHEVLLKHGGSHLISLNALLAEDAAKVIPFVEITTTSSKYHHVMDFSTPLQFFTLSHFDEFQQAVFSDRESWSVQQFEHTAPPPVKQLIVELTSTTLVDAMQHYKLRRERARFERIGK